MQHAVNVDRLHGGALQGGQENSAQRVAQRLSKATLKRLGHQRGKTVRVGTRCHLKLVRADKFLPIFLDRHCFTHVPVNLPTKLLALEIADKSASKCNSSSGA